VTKRIPDPVVVADQPGERDIEWIRLDEVVGADTNPREHNLPALRRAILRFGYGEPAMRDDRTGKLVAGHGRTAALAELVADEDVVKMVDKYLAGAVVKLPGGIYVDPAGRWAPNGVRINPGDGVWVVPVYVGWASKSDAEAAAYLANSNRQNELARWDQQGLADLLTSIKDEDATLMHDAGYEDGDYTDLLRRLEPDDLDDLAEDPDPSDMWPTVTVRKVPPHVAAAWRSHVDTCSGNEVAALAQLLEVDPEPPTSW
jgi:hypothetical protein